jgi:hypothetical protein
VLPGLPTKPTCTNSLAGTSLCALGSYVLCRTLIL